jgi:toxin ParE1/3/4
MKIVWTEPAVRDIAALRIYIGKDNAQAADRQAGRILAAIGGLALFPESGRPGRRAGTRELIVGRTPYLVAYRLRGESIQILRVLHGKQIWPDGL